MINEIIIGTIGSIVGAIITLVCTKLFWGFKHFRGIKKVARLNKDCYNAGIINVFSNRNAYIEHKDHGKSINYISKANHTVLYVGYWLATSTEIGELKETITQLINKQITVTLVFISPNDSSLEICSKYIATKPDEIKTRVKFVLKDIIQFKKNLDSDIAKYLIIKVHNIPLSTTAFIIDSSSQNDCKILLDYKIYNGSRESSYGIEYSNSKKTITQKVLNSYLSIAKSAIEINDVGQINKV
jgi:hypothetical protein